MLKKVQDFEIFNVKFGILGQNVKKSSRFWFFSCKFRVFSEKMLRKVPDFGFFKLIKVF